MLNMYMDVLLHGFVHVVNWLIIQLPVIFLLII
jgi:hypothetical protein